MSGLRNAFEIEDATQHEENDALFPRVAGSLIGAAAGDALGWITEFVRGPDHLRKLYGTDRVTDYRPWQKTTGGRFMAYIDHINPGEYSDDTQLTLAIARSIKADGHADVDHFAKRELPLWLDYARGAGLTSTAAARALKKQSVTWNANFFKFKTRSGENTSRDSGANGAAMRIGPLALANVNDARCAYESVWQTSVTTHGHPRAIWGAVLHAEALRYCLAHSPSGPEMLIAHLGDFVEDVQIPVHEPGISEWIARWDSGSTESFTATWSATRREVQHGLETVRQARPRAGRATLEELGCFDPSTKGSGVSTVLGSLVIFLLKGDDLVDSVVTAVNQIGTDTDTIAAFVGGLAGALHGYNAVPENWTVKLQDYDYFMRVATELSRVSKRRGIGGTALLPDERPRSTMPPLLDLLREKNVAAHERVHHPLFGAGWIEGVDVQRLRRKDGAQVVLVRVAFDMGQSCKFRYMEIPGKKKTTGSRLQPRKSTRSAPEKLF